jgi:hypothetical protein
MMNSYTITFVPYGDMPVFTGLSADEAYLEMQRLFMTDGKWDEAKIYAARLAYVEQHGLDPSKYHVRPWDLSSWQGPPPTPEPSPAKTRKRSHPAKKKDTEVLDFVGPRKSMTPWQRRRLVIACAEIGLAMRPPITKGDPN